MKFYLRLGLILLAFSIVATGILAYVNSITKPKIEALKIKEATEARSELIPKATFEEVVIHISEKDSLVYYVAKDEQSKALKGYTFTAEKYGYSSSVKTMVAVDSLFNVINIKVISQGETPGLGANCTAPTFAAKFTGLSAEQLLVDKDGGKIASMTGATITTRAIANSLKETIAIVRKHVESNNNQPSVEVKI